MGTSADGIGFRVVTIGYNVQTEEDVMKLYKQIKEETSILKAPTVPPLGGLFFSSRILKETFMR